MALAGSSERLPSGESEIDSVVLRLPDSGREITNWSRYSYNQSFTVPAAGWSFSLSGEDVELVLDLLAPGTRVQLVVNGAIQCTGFIDNRQIDSSGTGGTSVMVRGRDILGRVVDSSLDPAFRFAAGTSLLDVLFGVLGQFGIDTIFNSDAANINAITGLPTGVQGTRPDLKTVKLDQIKPRPGEGCYGFLDRLLKRFGLKLWATAEGSGVVVDVPDFTSAPRFRIVHRRANGSENNVLSGSVSQERTQQPAAVLGLGFGGQGLPDKSRLKAIQINELVGLNGGAPIPCVRDLLARYPGAKVLPIRPALQPLPRPAGDDGQGFIFTYFDSEAKTLEQLEATVRREMAHRQQRALVASYTIIGHTQNGSPWSVNTLVDVDDEVSGIHRPLWLIDRTFSKTPTGGTTSDLRLILPHTYAISA